MVNTQLFRSILLPLLPAFVVLESTVNAQGVLDGDGDEYVRLKLSFSSSQSRAQFQDSVIQSTSSTLSVNRGATWYDFKEVYQFSRTNVTALSIPKSQYASFMSEASQQSIEVRVDPKMSLLQLDEEVVPYGIGSVQGDLDGIPPPSPNNCFKVCLIDDGLLVSHSDIPYVFGEGNVQGKQFGLPDDKEWWNPSPDSGHGTHVAVSTFFRWNIQLMQAYPRKLGCFPFVCR